MTVRGTRAMLVGVLGLVGLGRRSISRFFWCIVAMCFTTVAVGLFTMAVGLFTVAVRCSIMLVLFTGRIRPSFDLCGLDLRVVHFFGVRFRLHFQFGLWVHFFMTVMVFVGVVMMLPLMHVPIHLHGKQSHTCQHQGCVGSGTEGLE